MQEQQRVQRAYQAVERLKLFKASQAIASRLRQVIPVVIAIEIAVQR